MKLAFLVSALALVGCAHSAAPANPTTPQKPGRAYIWEMHKRVHPLFANRLGALPPGHDDASVLVEVMLDSATGNVTSVTTAVPSGIPELDALALRAITDAAPFGPMPRTEATENRSRVIWRFFRAQTRACSNQFARIATPPSYAIPASMNWDECGFPEEADRAGVHKARVELTVSVSVDGTPTAAQATSNSGYGFAALAEQCALRGRYLPARNSEGEPVAGATKGFDVWFSR